MKTTLLPLNDPDLTQADLDSVMEILQSERLSMGSVVELFRRRVRALSRSQTCDRGE